MSSSSLKFWNSFLVCTFASVQIFSLLAGSISYSKAKEDREPPPEQRPIEISNIKNSHVAEVLAQSCGVAGWSDFTQWAKANGFLGRSIPDSISITTLKNGIRIENLDIETTFNNHKIELVFKGRKYSGSDACLAFMDFIKGEKSTEKNATDDASLIADSVALASSLSGELSGIDLLSKFPFDGAALPLIEVAFYFGTDASTRMITKIDLEHVLTADFLLKCNATTVSIQSATHKILIRKTATRITRKNTPEKTPEEATKNVTAGISVFDRESNLSDVTDMNSEYSKKALIYVSELAKNCNNAETADDIKRAAEDQLTQAHMKVATVNNIPGKANADRQPANDDKKP